MLRDVAELVIDDDFLQVDVGRAAVSLEIEIRLRNHFVDTLLHCVRTNSLAQIPKTDIRKKERNTDTC